MNQKPTATIPGITPLKQCWLSFKQVVFSPPRFARVQRDILLLPLLSLSLVTLPSKRPLPLIPLLCSIPKKTFQSPLLICQHLIPDGPSAPPHQTL